MARSLPPAPTLEALKKEAKALLKAHQSGDAEACVTLRLVPRLANTPDQKLLRAKVGLQEAQHALAKDYGFRDWKELKAYVESVRPAGKGQDDDLVSAMAGLPGREVLVAILAEATESGASDTHLEWRGGRLTARHRVDGALRASAVKIPEDQQHAVIDRIKMMAALDPKSHDRPQIGYSALRFRGREVNLRISVVPYVSGESIVARYLVGLQSRPDLLNVEALGLTDENLGKLRNWAGRPSGLIVVTGPTGSGRTTTIYSVLRELDPQERKIVTAEDPVECLLDGVQQQQIDPAGGLTYAAAIRQQMRQDPDVLLIGECSDRETLEVVLSAAVSGHLVFTTMHTNDAPSCLRRMLDMGGGAFMIGRATIGVLAQRLVRTICPDCREPYDPPDWVRDSLSNLPEGPMFRGKGCDACRGTGYRGRTGIHELLEMNDGLRAVVARAVHMGAYRQQAAKGGMKAMRADGLTKAAKGVTTVDEVLRVCPA